MAALTIGSAETPPQGSLKDDGVIFKTITGAGGDSSEIAAATAGYYHVIVDGRLSADGPDEVAILSTAAQRDILQFAARSTLTFPKGLFTLVGGALNLNKVGTSVTVDGWIMYRTIAAGEPFGNY